MAAEDHLGKQFLNRHLVEHHRWNPEQAHSDSEETANIWHSMEHELYSEGNLHWDKSRGQVSHTHSPERIHFDG